MNPNADIQDIKSDEQQKHSYIHRVNNPSAQFEPMRDWSIGFITGHRSRVVISMSAITIILYLYQEWLWPHSLVPHGWMEIGWNWGSLLWLGAVIPGTLGLLGMISFSHNHHLDAISKIDQKVSFRIVTKGSNIEAVASTIRRCQTEMALSPLFSYVIEVVIEKEARIELLPHDNDVVFLLIPKSYKTPNGSLYKARALQFALENSTLEPEAWIVHLDEETQPTSSGIKGICAMIQEEEANGRLRVGQGAILYHRDWRKHPILTLADNVRTGDDFARFHFQHRLGKTVFGLHGSYIVVRNDIESAIGFDFSPVGSITEDAFWALKLMESGGRARWCNGYLEEQSTQSIRDFIRQRQRWYQGLIKVALYAPVKLRWRIAIGANTFLWTFAPFAAMYTIIHFFYGFGIHPWIRLLANLSYASFTTLYLTGLKANMDEHKDLNMNILRRTGWTIAQILLTPFFSLLEACGVMSAILKPNTGFHVVKK